MARLDSEQNVAQLVKEVVIDLSKVHPQVGITSKKMVFQKKKKAGSNCWLLFFSFLSSTYFFTILNVFM